MTWGVEEGVTPSEDELGFHMDMAYDSKLEAYRDGFSDGLLWVLQEIDISEADRERIEEILGS